jgi:imidazolonepropionase
MPTLRLLHSFREVFTGSTAGTLHDAAIAIQGNRVTWIGEHADAPPADEKIDCSGLLALPGLVDCHTHAVFAGSRANEFEARLAGADYTEILEAGGGILATVRETRATTEESLAETLCARLDAMLLKGVTTVEIKSGYGLSPAAEHKMLRAAKQPEHPVSVRRTFLGAHAVPEELRGDRAAYVRQVIDEQLPLCADDADQIDVYCDRGAFSLEEAEQILAAGKAAGLGLRIHAEQVAHTGAAALGARLGAASADHLERIDDEGIAAMARAGTVAVLLPGALLYLKDAAPPVDKLRNAGVPLAVATDFNPGSSPVRDLLSCATLACLTMGLTVEEALLGITRNAAKALNVPDIGWLGPGARADLAIFAPPPGEDATLPVLIQYLGGHRAKHVLKNGEFVVRHGQRVQGIA